MEPVGQMMKTFDSKRSSKRTKTNHIDPEILSNNHDEARQKLLITTEPEYEVSYRMHKPLVWLALSVCSHYCQQMKLRPLKRAIFDKNIGERQHNASCSGYCKTNTWYYQIYSRYRIIQYVIVSIKSVSYSSNLSCHGKPYSGWFSLQSVEFCGIINKTRNV